jgi:hypothetical protein
VEKLSAHWTKSNQRQGVIFSAPFFLLQEAIPNVAATFFRNTRIMCLQLSKFYKVVTLTARNLPEETVVTTVTMAVQNASSSLW